MISPPLDLRQSPAQEAVFFPASFAQRSLWLIDQLAPGKATYNIPNALRFRGKLEVEALQRTLKEIVRRHETLRTRFVVVGGEPQQVIENHVDIELPLLDLTSIAGEKEREAEAVRLAREESQQPFNLKQAPLIRGKLLRLGASNHVLLFTMHHIVSDAWSTGVLVEEVSALYGAFSAGRPSPLPELPIQYADYSEWQREWLAGGQLEQQLGYWREQLAGVSVLQLPTDRPRPASRTESGATRDFVVAANVGYQLKKLGEEQGATLFMVLLAAFQTLLYRYSGQDDIAVGTPIAGRRRSETEKLIGFFINTLVLRGDLSGAPSFTELLQRTKKVTLGAYAHQDLPFQKLVEVLSPERNLGNTPLFQVMLGLQNASQAELRLGAAVLQPFDVVDNGTAKFDLLLQHSEDGSGMLMNSLQYSTDLFEAATIQRMISHYGLLLASITTSPHMPIASLEMLSAEERSMLLHDFNATAAPIPEKTVASLFEEQVGRTPDATAVRCGGEALSYRELDQRANQLGHHLKQMGVNPEMLVGICLNRSLDMVVALLGVLKSGGAYVPLDPSYPVERLGFMMEDAQIPVLVTESALLGSLPMSMVQIVSMDEDWKEISANSTERVEGSIDSSNLAYVIYTSGSTGQPKGVGVTHQGMVNYVNWAGQAYRMSRGSGSPVHSSLAFDLTVTSIYPALLNGGWLEVLPQAAGMEELAQQLEASEYGLVKLTPSHLRMLGLLLEKRDKNGQGEPEAGALVIGGEALRYADLELWRKPGSKTRLINEYGPTETVVGSTIYEVKEEREAGDVPVGKPIANTGIYVLDANLETLPVGVVGELYIGGAGLARGYVNRPALTAERFLPNPYGEAGARMYRTGDLARWRGDGNLEYLGRNDQQVKIRGFRIELGEIEAMVESHASVAQAVVLAREDQPGEKRLVAYVVKKAEAAMPGTGELTDYLKARLPEHMVPAVLVELEKWPLTHNGKIAREKLPQPGTDRAQQEYVGPQNPTEETLCQVWQEVLQRERVGIHDNFFTLGGHSLLAVQASARMRERFKLDVPIRVLFELPTVAQMARHIAEASNHGQPQATPIPVSARRQGATTPVFPASFAQRSLWFIDQLNPGKATYNIPNALRIRGELELEVMKRTLEEIARRHETLRTRFVLVEGDPQQVVEEHVEIELPVLDLTSIAEEKEREAEAVRLAREEAQQPFNLQQAPLLRGKLLRLDTRNHVLLFTLHHIISDAWSAGVLAEEVSVLYGAFSAGQPSPLPELPIQYADYSEWQRGWLEGGPLEEQLAYWKEQLAGVSMLQLPTDRPRPASRSESGATRGFVIEAEVAQPLKKLAEGQGATLFMVMLAAFQTLLYRYSGQEDIAVGTPNAGRGRSETEKLIGFFINTLVLRGDLSGGPSFTELLERTKKVTLGAYAHQDIPFQKLVEVLSPERNLGNTPLFQVMLGLQNAPQGDLRLGTATLEGFNNVDSGTAKFDLLLLHAEDGTGALMGSLEYSTDLFEADTIQRMIGHYSRLLASIASTPQQPIHSLEILSAAERSMLLEDWNVTRAFLAEPTLTRLFEQQVARTPNAIAVQCGEDSLSYFELNQRANQLAHHLRGMGVGPEVLVGICMERSLELVLGLLGILKAGGAYLPLDPHYPAERVSYMLEDAGVKVVVSQASVQEVLPQHGAEVLLLDQGWEAIAKASVSDVESGATSENVAYVIYTSGSTGKPKGVLVTHGNVVRLMRATEGWFGFNPQDVWTMFHSYAFDFSVWELWGALLYGGRLEVVPYWVSRSPEAFYELVKDRGVTVLNQTPSAFQQFSREDEAKAEGLKLRLVIFGGEALEMSSLRPWFERHGDEIPQMVNMYGITETTVHVTYKVLTKEAAQGKASVIGVRIPDLQMYILQEMEPVPVGVVGEMYVGGAGLARGYWSRAELTAQRFVPHPFSERPGERLYRTGDLGRYRADGGIEYLGRMDQQVKIRGHRIELGEIEAALEGHEGVKQAVVLVREDQPGEKRLVAYVVKGGGESEFDAGQMRSHLQTRLPDYMVPGALVVLEKMPLTAHGKLDRKALPRPEWGGDERKYVGPRNGVEEELSRIWSEVLGVERVGIQDNFFELGGDSIVSIRILARARESGLKIELRQLFEQQTIERLAQVVTGVEVKEEGEGEAARSGEPFSLISEADRRKLPEDVEDAYPVSRLQAGMLFHNEFNLETPLYYNISSFHLRAPFDGEVLRRAVEEVVERHEVLRTSFHISGFSQPLQWVHRTAKIKITVDDLRHLSTEQQEEALKGWEEQEKRRRFVVSQPGLLRVHVHRRTEESLQFSLIEHHVILDGWSVASLLTELFGCYFGMLKGEWKKAKSLGSRFRDFVGAEMEVLESEEAQRFWQQQLEGMEVATPPWEKQRSEKAAMAGLEVPIEEKTSEALTGWARQLGVPVKSVLLAAHVRVLSLITGQRDVITGITSNGRMESRDAEQVLGLFLNSPPFRMQLPGGTWKELVQETAGLELALLPYRRYPLADIQRLAGGAALFEVSFNFVHFHIYRELARLGSVEILGGTAFAYTNFTLNADFTLDPVQSTLQLVLSYNASLVSKEQVETFGGYYQNALKAMVADPEGRYETTSLLSEEERAQVLYGWNSTAVEYPRENCLHELFEQQAARTPNAIAVQCGEDFLSYRELNQRANQLAHHLRGMGVGPEVLVGICMERSLELVLGLLGILKAGGAYLPLDPHYPAERVSYMLEDAGVKVVVSQASVQEVLPQHGAEVLLLDQGWEDIAKASVSDVESQATSENVAYVIYTSGSTGKPKGVLVTHGNVVRLMRATEGWFGFNPQDVWTMFHSYAFDFSVWELWGALLYGGRLEVVPYWVSRSPEAFYELVKDRGVTVLNQTPSAFQQFSREDEAKAEGLKLRLVIFGGEALEMSSLRPWFERHGDEIPQMVNMYGITETTVHVTYKVLTKEAAQGKASVIGVRIPDLQMYILQEMEPVPVGVVGEMYVGGAGLARGYWSRAELTAQRFVPHPFSERPGERLYRTGDLGRYRADGGIEYLGRMDQQVKIRGHRIELGEIEAALEGHEGVKQAVVLVREDQPGEKRLVAYVVKGGGESEFDVSQMRSHLQTRLPDYMVPGALVVLEKMPLTAHGKLDRKALPRPEWGGDERKYVGPRNAVEEELSRIWSEVLGVERVGIQDNFFELGGDSIVSIRILARAQEAGLKIELRQLFEQQTIERLAQVVTGVQGTQEGEGKGRDKGKVKGKDEGKDKGKDKERPFSLISEADRRKLPEDVEDAYPVSRLQAGMLFHNEFNLETPLYYNISSFHLRAPFDGEVLRRAVEEVVERHEVLRTSFHISGFSQPLQWVHRTAKIEIEVDDLRHLSTEQQEEALKGWEEQEKQRRFDVSQPGLLRVHVHRRTEESLQFSLIEHHVILDGWSVASLLTELFGCYFGMLKGEWKKAKSLGSRFRDFVGAEMEVLESEEAQRFWQQQLEGMEVATPPWEKQRSEKADMAALDVPITAETSKKLSEWARQLGVPVKSVLLAAHVRVLSLITGQRDVITGITSNGRMESRDAEQVLGLLLNSPPFRMQLPGGTWKELVQETARLELALLPYRRYPLADIQRLAGGAALFDVNFNFVHFHIYRELARLGSVEVLSGSTFAYTNFTLNAGFSLDPVQSSLQLELSYNASLVSKEQVESIGGYYQNALKAMVAGPEGRYETTSLLSEEERAQVLYGWNSTTADYRREHCLHELFEQQVGRTPDAIAVQCGEDSLSYIELDQRANQLAHYLKQRGIGPEKLVGICLNRSLDMIVALLGILKSGGAYVPLDPSLPVERLGFMLEEARIAMLLTQASLRHNLGAVMVQMVSMDEDWKDISANSTARVESGIHSSNLAYVIYTSGSTGRPKGVGVTHKGMVNYVDWARQAYRMSRGSGSPVHSSLAFDLTVTSIYPALLSGGWLEVLPQSAGMEELAQQLEASDYSVLKLTPSHLRMLGLLLEKSEKGEHGARVLVIGGEALRYADLELWRKPGSKTRLINEYGPTETVVGSTIYEVKDERRPGDVPVGKPIANTKNYVLDADLQALPVGVAGELYIGGVGLARGYVNRPNLTAERFLPNPYGEPGARMYRTGDLARWRGDGNLEYLGRNDQQVKIRGFRIELGEIEAALEAEECIRQAVVMALEDAPGNKRLVAYVVVEPEREENGNGTRQEGLRISELRERLLGKLPEYMVPSAYVQLEKLPLNHNGKVDRKSLPQPGNDTPEREYVGPRNPTEETLCRLWQEVLGLEHVGIHDNFFEIGGHSLLALRAISRIKVAFAMEMPLSVLFAAPTVARMAEHITAMSGRERTQSSPVVVSIQPHGSSAPFFCVHAVGGQVISYAELSQELGLEQPFYGLQSPPANFFPEPGTSIEQLATLYNREIRSVQPVGPYLLGGWSMGGLIAWEMAQQLVKEGETIGMLALLDTTPPPKYREADDQAEEMSMLARFALDMSRLVGRDPRPLAEKFSQAAVQDQWKMVQEALTSYGVLTPKTAHAEMTALLDVFTRNFLAINDYSLRQIKQPVVFFRAAETPERLAKSWTTWADGGIKFHEVPGDHFTILRRPNVGIIAEILQRYIAGNSSNSSESANPELTAERFAKSVRRHV